MSTSARVSVRDFRKNLKAHIDSGKVIAIGSTYYVRAFLVSIPPVGRWDDVARRKALRAARCEFLELVKQELA